MASLAEKYSGIVVNQNQKPTASDDHLDLSDGLWRFQEVFLPSDYPRGEERLIPDLSGWQLLTSITDANTTIEWKLQYDLFGTGWLDLASGSSTGAQAIGSKVWFDMLFATPVSISEDILVSRLRFGFRATSGSPAVWYSAPNPLALKGFVKAYQADGTTAIQDSGNDISVCFRVLGLTADEGVDFLGNRYRSALVTVDGSNDTKWMSKPNPSRFAVENRYFDIRPRQDTPTYDQDANPQPLTINDDVAVVDAITVDPTTPGIYFNVYYSNEGDAETTEEGWDNKLWTRVPKTFHAVKREAHVLPEPILAKYVKIEFTHLQAKYYAPGDFAKPIRYKKHPKWVLDYFLARLTSERATENLLGGRVAVVYDALDLAYNYYLDDLAQEPNAPVEVNSSFTTTSIAPDASDQVDPTMITKINLAMAPYTEHPSGFSKSDYLLGNYAQQVAPATNYPTETSASVTFPDVQELRNASVIFENDYPVMFFYLTCRHKYREIVAEFSHDRAYFAGVQEITFSRERYASAFDTNQYTEPAGDLLNIERNDFAMVEGTMVIQ